LPKTQSGYGDKGRALEIKGTTATALLVIPATRDGSCVIDPSTPDTATDYCDYQVGIAPLLSPDWSLVSVDFRLDLAQPSSTPDINRVTLETALEHAKEIHWQILTSTDPAELDVWIDNVELWGKAPGQN
jgi:hypothetical protein